MPRRLVVAVVLALAATGATGVAGAAKSACFQITDGTGDAYAGGSLNPAAQPSSDSLDIVSGDIATGKRNLVAAIRLKTYGQDPATTGGSTFVVEWTSAGTTRSLTYRTYADQPPDGLYDADTAHGTALDYVQVVAQVNVATATITMTLPRKLEPALAKPKAKLGGLAIRTGVGLNRNLSYSSTGIDTATSGRTYADGAPTCLKGV